jgi:hypothetical protein
MSKHMRRDTFLLQRMAAVAGGAHVLGQEMLDGIAAELSPVDIREQGVCRLPFLFPQPSTQNRRRLLAKGSATLLPPLALAPDMCPATYDNVLAAKSYQL